MIDSLLTLLQAAFRNSPSLGFAVLLLLWLLGGWWFRLIHIGPKYRYPQSVLRRFGVEPPVPAFTSIDDLGRTPLTCLSPTGADMTSWQVGEMFRVYWVLWARGWIFIVTSFLYLFFAFSIVVMLAASPTGEVSLVNVVSILGYTATVAFWMLLAVSLMVVLSSAHTLPAEGPESRSRLVVFLFAW